LADSWKIPRSKVLQRGLLCRCPNCGHTDIFSGLRLLASCPVCYMSLQRGSGWWLGPLVINYGMVSFGIVLPLLAAGLGGLFSLKLAIYLALGAALIIAFFLYRLSWSLWLMCYYLVLPDELPGNNSHFDLIDND